MDMFRVSFLDTDSKAMTVEVAAPDGYVAETIVRTRYRVMQIKGVQRVP